jgi:putative flippase GtrA
MKIINTFKNQFFVKNKKIQSWVFFGLLLLCLNNFLIFYFVEYTRINIYYITLMAAILCNIIRYMLNNYIVFRSEKFDKKNFIKYQISVFFSLLFSYSVTSILIYLNVQYLVANNIGILFATALTFFLNFFWVWKNKR